MYELKKKFKISSAHRLNCDEFVEEANKKVYGKCNVMHGHNYYITLILRNTDVGTSGMMINFDELKKVFKEHIDDVYDHQVLNDCPGFDGKVPTAENMAKVFYTVLKSQVKFLYAIEVEETEGASATYYGSE